MTNKANLIDVPPGTSLANHDHLEVGWGVVLILIGVGVILLGIILGTAVYTLNARLDSYKPFLCTAPAEVRSEDCEAPGQIELEQQIDALQKQLNQLRSSGR